MNPITEKTARKIVKQIMDDLSDRSGFDLYGLDGETRREIKQTWTGIIMSGVNSAPAEGES